jgi:hypothetical protein
MLVAKQLDLSKTVCLRISVHFNVAGFAQLAQVQELNVLPIQEEALVDSRCAVCVLNNAASWCGGPCT